MDVRLEDQERINRFSRLNARSHDLKAQLKVRKRSNEDYEEASNEIMLLDDESVPFVIGDCMVHLPRDEVEERLEKMQQESEVEIEKLEKQIAKIEEEMSELKKVLYARFGNSINLEE